MARYKRYNVSVKTLDLVGSALAHQLVAVETVDWRGLRARLPVDVGGVVPPVFHSERTDAAGELVLSLEGPPAHYFYRFTLDYTDPNTGDETIYVQTVSFRADGDLHSLADNVLAVQGADNTPEEQAILDKLHPDAIESEHGGGDIILDVRIAQTIQRVDDALSFDDVRSDVVLQIGEQVDDQARKNNTDWWALAYTVRSGPAAGTTGPGVLPPRLGNCSQRRYDLTLLFPSNAPFI